MFALTIPGLQPLSKAFAYALHWLATIAGGNYGVAIIMLTILMRIVILPLSIKQTKSMIAMQKLQPQLKEIQKKYKDDREKMGQEMMALYKENKVSPLGGCLPLLLQLPIIFAVFEVLRSLANPKSSFFNILFPHVSKIKVAATPQLQFAGMNITYTGAKLWSKAGGQAYAQVIVLMLLTVITGYVSAKMMTTDPKQAKMMAMMPVLMGVFAWILPAGVTIYIIVTNIITMVQQYIQLEHEGFFDEKLAELSKLGDKAKWYQRAYLRSMNFGTKLMVAVKLRPKTEVLAQKGKAAAGKAAKEPVAAVAGQAKSNNAKPSAKQTDGKKHGQPAQKKASPGQAQKRLAQSSGGQRAPSRKKPSGQPVKQQQGSAKHKSAASKPAGARPAAKKDSGKNYPAKKKGSGKK